MNLKKILVLLLSLAMVFSLAACSGGSDEGGADDNGGTPDSGTSDDGNTPDDGSGENRTILSGIHEYYEPEELVGKTCIAIVNLPPRAMMGIDSCGMLLSAGIVWLDCGWP